MTNKTKKQTDTIHQRRSDDCGIAALAMLLSVAYEDVAPIILDGSPFDGTTVTHARKVAREHDECLRLWNCTASNRDAVVRRLMGRPAVLVVPAQDHKISGEYHALYWSGKHILDPSPHRKYGRKGTKALKTFTEAWVLA